MARQNVGQPKFYVDMLSYWKAKGMLSIPEMTEDVEVEIPPGGQEPPEPIYTTVVVQDFPRIIGLRPSNFTVMQRTFPSTLGGPILSNLSIPQDSISNGTIFFGLLGHNFGQLQNSNDTERADIQVSIANTGGTTLFETYGSDDITTNEVCNWNGTKGIGLNGWSLCTADITSEISAMSRISLNFRDLDKYDGDNDGVPESETTIILGNLSFGYVYQMDRSPDLSLSMTREYDGVRTQKTRGGSRLAQINYSSPPQWAGLPAWELLNYATYFNDYIEDEAIPSVSRGRRTWNLKFSHLSSDNLFAVNELRSVDNPTDSSSESSNAGYDTSDFDSTGNFDSTIEHDSSFFGAFMEKTMGGNLPFIFQPDGNNNSPDQFAICVLDQQAIKFTQVAHNTYNISLKIREVW